MNKRNSIKIAGLAIISLSILLTLGCASTPTQESAGQYVDSTAITTEVKADLLADSRVKSLPITVNTYKNQVQLSGFVKSAKQAEIAGQIARSVKGVAGVDNNLIVR